MKKNDLRKAVWHFPRKKQERVKIAVEKFESRMGGKKGTEDAREKFFENLKKLYPAKETFICTPPTHLSRLAMWRENSAKKQAALAGQHPDKHGYKRGDYLAITGLDFVGAWQSNNWPYLDAGGAGIGLVNISRTRIYAKSCKWRPSITDTMFLVGRNESGTYFTHPVSPACGTVLSAIRWIWGGKEYEILQRQGDIALVECTNKGGRMPTLPAGHRIEGEFIVHASHEPLPLPKVGQRIIIGRRAAERASAATRD